MPVLLTQPEILNTGDRYRHIMAGGGGYGDPLEREPELVLQDAMEEKITAAHARNQYGVVLDTAASKIDTRATLRLRAEMKK